MNLKASDEKELEQAEIKQLQELRSRDLEVRTHEQAHLAAAGALATSGPAFDYERGPDGRLYAVGGEVHIDTSAESGDPEATLDKARQIRRAALAPAQPSAQDQAVAAQAAALEAQARLELAAQQGGSNPNDSEETVEAAGAVLKSDNARCTICGGQHSTESHIEGVKNDLQTTFFSAQNAEKTGGFVNVSV